MSETSPEAAIGTNSAILSDDSDVDGRSTPVFKERQSKIGLIIGCKQKQNVGTCKSLENDLSCHSQRSLFFCQRGLGQMKNVTHSLLVRQVCICF